MTPDLPTLIAALREAARKATPGPWDIADSDNAHCMVTCGRDDNGAFLYVATAWEQNEDAAYIALANPTNVLALLDALESTKMAGFKAGIEAGALIASRKRLDIAMDIREFLASEAVKP